MHNPLRDWVPEPFTAGTAFVVHLELKAADVVAGLQGRVEHVRSGQSRRFGSTEELVAFMCEAVAIQADSRTRTIRGSAK